MSVAHGPGARGLRPADDVLRGGWDRALRLAWEGFRARTTPVGAVVVDERGAILAEGRGRRYDATAPAGQLAGTLGALAEMLHVAFLTSRGRHVLDAQRAAMPELTAYTEDVLGTLEDAARRDDYDRALDLAAAAPRPIPDA